MGLAKTIILIGVVSPATCFAGNLTLDDQATQTSHGMLVSFGQWLDRDRIQQTFIQEIEQNSYQSQPWSLQMSARRSTSAERVRRFAYSLQAIIDQSLMNLQWLKHWREGVDFRLADSGTENSSYEIFDSSQNLAHTLLVAELKLNHKTLRDIEALPEQTLILGDGRSFYTLQADVSPYFELDNYRHRFNLSFSNTTITHERDENLESSCYALAYNKILKSHLATRLEFLPQTGASHLELDLKLPTMKFQMSALLTNSSDDINSIEFNAELSF